MVYVASYYFDVKKERTVSFE